MRLIDAATLRDGGSTTITVSSGLFRQTSYTLDFSLPWDGRRRHIYRRDSFRRHSRPLEINGPEEQHLRQWLHASAAQEFADTDLENFLSDRFENPGTGKWRAALNFLKILTTERSREITPALAEQG